MNNSNLDAGQVGTRIRALRRQRNWTQATLAEKVGICTGPMNALENGHHLPSLPVLCKLADAFACDVNELLYAQPYACPATGAVGVVREHCEDVSTNAWELYAADAAAILRFEPNQKPLTAALIDRINAIIGAYLALEDICGVQKQALIPLRLALPQSRSGLVNFANRVRSLFGIQSAVIFDYLELFENAGLRVIFLPLEDDIHSLSCYDRRNENAFFFIDPRHNVERQLFVLCYELGRIYLYNGGMGQKARIGDKDFEHAARYFGAMFLMPEDAVRTTVAQVGIKADEWSWEMLMRLKHRFGVSAEAFLYRLDELRLIKPVLKRQLKVAIKAHYSEHGHFSEPDSTRRILSPNGRLGDLLLQAYIRHPENPEVDSIRQTLKQNDVENR